jgi:hypothetical protein
MENNTNKINQLNKIFNSINNKHQIEVNIVDNISWFNINKFDYENCRTFLLTLKDVLLFLKKNNVEYIKQNILEDDIKYFKYSSVINKDENQYIVSTSIDKFVDEIINVFDIKKI